MKIYIGADHNGYALKRQLTEQLTRAGYEVIDEGDEHYSPDDDFPQFAEQVVRAMQSSDDNDVRGVLICGSGQGMCMAANRFKGIRASLIWDPAEAHAARNDDDSNIICLPGRTVDAQLALQIVQKWLITPFAGAPRFKRRIAELDRLA